MTDLFVETLGRQYPGRTGAGLVQQAPQDDIVNQFEPDEDRRPWQVMIFDVVDIRIFFDQLIANVLPHYDD